MYKLTAYMSALLLTLTISTEAHAQRPTNSNLYSQVKYYFHDYPSLTLVNEEVEMDNREDLKVVTVYIDDIDWFHLNVFVFDNQLIFLGGVDGDYIPPSQFANAQVDRSGVWDYGVDDDFDLEFSTEIDLGNYRKKSEVKEVVMLVYEVLIDELTDESYLQETESLADQYSVQACIEGVEGAIKDMPYEYQQYIFAENFCNCIAEEFNKGGDKIFAVLNPTSPEGKELLRLCFPEYCPECPNLGLTFDLLFGAIDNDDMKEKSSEAFIKACVRGVDGEGVDASFAQMEEYCECAYEELLAQGESGKDLTDYYDPNSTDAFELAAGCVHLLTDDGEASDLWNSEKGVALCNNVVAIPLVEMNGGFYAKVQIGSESRYMLVDSGASEVLIDGEWAVLLQQLGILSTYSVGSQMFSIADDSQVQVDIYEVSSFQVGDCSYRDFQVGVIEEGGMLLGMGFLGLFGSWELDRDSKTLILKK